MLDSIDYRSIYDGQHPDITIISFKPNESDYYLNKSLKHDLNVKYDKAAIIELTKTNDTMENITYRNTVYIKNTEKYIESVRELTFALSVELGVVVGANLFYLNRRPRNQ